MQVQQLPAGITAESIIEQQFEEQKKQLQERFELGWNTINERGRTIGRAKRDEMLAELHGKARAQALELEQNMQSQTAQFKQLDDMEKQGLITNGAEAKLRMVLGSEAERYLPKEPTAGNLEAEYGKVAVYRNRIRSELEDYGEIPGGLTERKVKGHKSYRDWYKAQPRKWYAPLAVEGEPEYEETRVPSTITKIDYNELYTDEKGNIKSGVRKDATEEETARYYQLRAEEERTNRELSGMVDTASTFQRVARSSPKMGRFNQKVTASIQPGPTIQPKQLDDSTARTILQEAGGDKVKARQIAKARGYSF